MNDGGALPVGGGRPAQEAEMLKGDEHGMSRDSGPVVPLEQRCIEPGHWLIEGRDVRAVYEGRSRRIMCWTVEILDGEENPGPFTWLAGVREWIRDQKEAVND